MNEPAKHAMKTAKPWYKKWWGVLVAICIWPFFIIWYAWARSHWDKGAKIAVTILLGFVLLFYFAVAAAISQSSSTTLSTSTPTTQPSTQAATKTTPTPSPAKKSTPAPTLKPAPSRQVTGNAVTLGAGTFTGGKDVATGLYDVTAGAGQNGNFMVSGDDSYNEILGVAYGQGVPKIRVKISKDDKIEISSLSRVIFTPVSTPFSTAHTITSLYAGTFIVGEDLGEGRYVATPGAGQSGNFQVEGSNSYNEILGGSSSLGGVPSLTLNLSKSDIISISSLSQVNFAPSN